jgi:hypothetical protein
VNARFCSKLCSNRENLASAISSGKRKGPPLCEVCGGRVSRREYKQCAECRGKGRPKKVAP